MSFWQKETGKFSVSINPKMMTWSVGSPIIRNSKKHFTISAEQTHVSFLKHLCKRGGKTILFKLHPHNFIQRIMIFKLYLWLVESQTSQFIKGKKKIWDREKSMRVCEFIRLKHIYVWESISMHKNHRYWIKRITYIYRAWFSPQKYINF